MPVGVAADADVEVAAVTGTECDAKFQKGEKWLVYARRKSPDSRLEVATRRSLYSGADKDLSYIRSSPELVPESSIIVRVFEYPYTPLKGMSIEVEGNGFSCQATTDKEGQVIVTGIKPARYTIRSTSEALPTFTGPRFPSRVEERGKSTLVEYEDEIKQGRCGYFEFFVMEMRKKTDGL